MNHNLRTCIVVGGGLAGSSVARTLAQRGWQVQVLDPCFAYGSAAAQTGHVAAAMTPLISVDGNLRDRLCRVGHVLSMQRWQQWLDETVFEACGTIKRVTGDGTSKNLLKAASLQDDENIQVLTPEQASELAGIEIDEPCVWFKNGCLVYLDKLVNALLNHSGIERIAKRADRIAYDEQQQIWQVFFERDNDETAVLRTSTLILASSVGTLDLLKRSGLLEDGGIYPDLQAMQALGGQIMYVDRVEHHAPTRIVAGSGYLLPAGKTLVCGSTYQHGEQAPCITLDEQKRIIEKMPKQFAKTLTQTPLVAGIKTPYLAWSGTRPVLRGRLPMIGALDRIAPNLMIATGYASHGLSWSMLGAEIIACLLHAEALPIEEAWYEAISPR